ncbi:hypothetical protein [Winogradskyella ursingii]|uniref:hypothetical protein n=1 Tax=Winogradskyella ursingii TaxID=2686079 RepID=UPI0015C6F6AD|nr:hypothetical protein [Winogradskyella ursingii]
MKLFKFIMSLILTLTFSLSTLAQSTEFKTSRNLGFKDSSKTQEITINIKEKTSNLTFEILCKVKEGNVTVEIYDPSGHKQGEFAVESIESQSDSDGEVSLFSAIADGVSGEIKKAVYEPELGKWVVKFIPKKATGRIQIISYQLQ